MSRLFQILIAPLLDISERALRRDVEARGQLTKAASPETARRAAAISASAAPVERRADSWLDERPVSVSEANHRLRLQPGSVGKPTALMVAESAAPAPPPIDMAAEKRAFNERIVTHKPASDETMDALARAEAALSDGVDFAWDEDDEDEDDEAVDGAAGESGDDEDQHDEDADDSAVADGGSGVMRSSADEADAERRAVDDLVNEDGGAMLSDGDFGEEDAVARLEASPEGRQIGRMLATFVARAATGRLPTDLLLNHLGKLMGGDISALLDDPTLGRVEKEILSVQQDQGHAFLRSQLPAILGWEVRGGTDTPNEVEVEVEVEVDQEDMVEIGPGGASAAQDEVLPESPPTGATFAASRVLARADWWSPLRTVDRSALPKAEYLRAFRGDPVVAKLLIAEICNATITDFQKQYDAVRRRLLGLVEVNLGAVDQAERDVIVMSVHDLDASFFAEIDEDLPVARSRFLSMAAFVFAFDRMEEWIDGLDRVAARDFEVVVEESDRARVCEAIEHLEIFVATFDIAIGPAFLKRVSAAWKRRQAALADLDNAAADDGLSRGLALFKASRLEGDVQRAFDGFVLVARAFGALETVIAREVSRLRGKGQEDHALFGSLQKLRAEGVSRAIKLRDDARTEGLSHSSMEQLLAAQGEGVRDIFNMLLAAREVVIREKAAESELREQVRSYAAERQDLVGKAAAAQEAEAQARGDLAAALRADSLVSFVEDFKALLDFGATANVHAMESVSVVRDVRKSAISLVVDVRERQVGFLFMHGGNVDDWTLRDGRHLASLRLGMSIDLGQVHANARRSVEFDRGRPLALRVVVCHGAVAAGADIAVPFGALSERRAALFMAAPADQSIQSASDLLSD